jgi:hypothetical protein
MHLLLMHLLLGIALGVVLTVIGIVVWIEYAGRDNPRSSDR